MSNSVENTFSKWRIYLALAIGLSISIGIIIYSFTRTEFHRVAAGKGTHTWVDANNNNKIDATNPLEFKETAAGDFEEKTAWEVLSSINWNSSVFFWLLLACVGMLGRDFGYMLRIRILTKKQLSWKQSFHVIMLWEFASTLAPGVMGGTAVAMFILNKEKISMGKSTAIVIMTAFMDNLFYVILVPLLTIFVPVASLFPDSGNETVRIIFWTGFGFFTLLSLFLFSSIVLSPNLVGSVLKGITRLPFLKKMREGAARTGQDVATTAHEMRKEPFSFWLKAYGATLISWCSRFLVINCMFQAFLQLGIFQHIHLFMKQFVLWMFLRVSPTPGGSGVAEWAFSTLMHDFSTSFILVSTLAVLWRLISYYPYIVIGSILLPKWLGKKRD
jgi:hypothetical protein